METFVGDELKISVRNLVEFIFRTGNIDNRRTTGADKDAMQEGSRIHRRIQGKMGSDYKAEVPLKMEFAYEKFKITVDGRADGIIDGDVVTVDEIKGVYRQVTFMKEPVYVHKAQAMCYGYMYCVKHNLDRINVQLTYCNIETEEIVRFKELYEFTALEEWFAELMDEYYKWADYIYESREKRNKSIRGLEFPFEYREGQRDIVVSVYKAIRLEKELFVQAPTGVGKTMSTVFPAVKAVGEEIAEKIFYLTAKTITRTVAAASLNILREEGLDFKSVIITAKDKVCVMEETECNPIYCKRALGHFDRINDAVYDVITSESDITREVIEEYARKHNVCPFELGLDVSNWVDGIICDYNYVFDPNVKLKRYFADGNRNKYVFLVDESHNLVERAREMYSASLYKDMFTDTLEIMEKKSRSISNALRRCDTDMLDYKRNCPGYMILDNVNEMILHLMRLHSLLNTYLEENLEFEGRKEVLEFYFAINNFLNVYENLDECYRTYCIMEDNNRFMLKLFCINPSNNLKECMKTGVSTIFFSATLLPVMYYKELLSGNCDDYAIYIKSPFLQENRQLLVASDVSSKYTRRSPNEYRRMFEYIKKVYSAKSGNYMVFFPSYKLMEEVYGIAVEKKDEDVKYIIQKNDMNEQDREKFLDEFDNTVGTMIAFCVLGGVFSEGIDLVSDKLIGSIVIGTGLPQVCPEREILKRYFDENGRKGFNYAYRYPGMNKVLQAAGRVIRTTEDVGTIALLDERFMEREYVELFPIEWNDYKVIDISTIDKEMGDFWDKFV